MKHEIVKTIDEMKEVDFCMYCGSKLDKIEGKNEKVCPKDCLRMKFVSIGEELPKSLFNIFDEKTISKKVFDEISHCKPPMVS
jgi:NADH pyrophosphatase NudC (nudix superfamily)